MYDIIGDIHGHADELIALLTKMEYTNEKGHYAHSTRTAVFVGDFIDRGPKIRETLAIVRPMVEAGDAKAVMGNHEFNAIAFHTSHKSRPTGYLRAQNEKNCHQHQATLDQLTKKNEINDAIEWFRTLPMWLELDGINVVHACWQPSHHATIKAAIKQYGGITTKFMVEATDQGTDLYLAVDDVLKGKEIPLPDGVRYEDKDGNLRTDVRVKWFESSAGKTYRQYALPATERIPEVAVPAELADHAAVYDGDAPPVFVGHYWLSAETPSRLAPKIACVDYSVAKEGLLCAYRWGGEQEVDDEHFQWVGSRK